MPEPIVIVGSSIGGLSAAEGLRDGGYDGDIVLVDPDPDAPYDRPALSKRFLLGEEDAAPSARGPERLVGLAAERVRDVAVSVDPAGHTVMLDSGRALHYSRLVVATGASPRRPASMCGPAGVFVLRSFHDARALREALREAESVVVVGAGFLGTEVAAAAATAGRVVTLVDTLPLPLAGAVGAVVAQRLANVHRARGVRLRLGVGVERLTDGQRVTGVQLADGSVIPATVVVLALGVAPVVDWLATAGLEQPDGVVVDAHMRAAPDVFAVGDVARAYHPLFGRHLRFEHWTTAVAHGRTAADTMLNGAGEGNVHMPYVWSEQFDVRLAMIGLTAGLEPVVVEQDADKDRFVVAYVDRDSRVNGVLTWNWARAQAAWRPAVAERRALAEAR